MVRPTAESYFGRVNSSQILAAIDEAKGEHAPALEKLKKARAAARAEKLVGKTSWLPEPLRIALVSDDAADGGKTDLRGCRRVAGFSCRLHLAAQPAFSCLSCLRRIRRCCRRPSSGPQSLSATALRFRHRSVPPSPVSESATLPPLELEAPKGQR